MILVGTAFCLSETNKSDLAFSFSWRFNSQKEIHMQITHLTLNSPNPAAQGDFFAQHFGVSIERESNRVTIPIGNSRLSFVQGDFPARAHYAFDIPENQFAEATTWLRQRLPIEVDEAGTWHYPSADWNSDSFYFYDADKNIVEFIARHNQPTASQSPFSGKSLVSISEIGLVTQDVQETVAHITKELGLKIWRGEGSETFTAIGDEDGLMIVTLEGRAWRPENIGAKPAVIQLELGAIDRSLNFKHLPFSIVPNF
jgi:catechol-2,3-dioxygenase